GNGNGNSSSSSSQGTQPAAIFPEQSGASRLWAQGDTGSGVNVAVLDTGIDQLSDFGGRLVGGVDLSGEGNPFQDSYGHGTFVAGLIAGNGASSKGQYSGEAPGAGLVSVKVAGASGQTDLATVIAGVDWVIDNHRALNIQVLNMSLGYEPASSTAVNPLDIAVEKAWNAGVTVVTSAGNYGPYNGTITSPGDDPLVITVGAVDDMGQTNPADDTMTDFSSTGPTNIDGWLKPDLVASGRSVVSLAAPGSTVYEQNPSALIGSANFVGSGTSFSAAITSGAAALLIEKDPGITPNEVKAQLLGSASPGPVGNPLVDGHGVLNVYGAATDGPVGSVQLTQASASIMQLLAGLESYSSTSGNVSLSTSWALSSWNPSNWMVTRSWNSPTLNGEAWNGEAWNGEAWNGEAWNGEAWNGEAW
ncbi:MAG: S8 family peptidase, partial [Nitrososphaerales archaeon]